MCLSFALACGAEPGLDDFFMVDGIYTRRLEVNVYTLGGLFIMVFMGFWEGGGAS